MPAPAWENLDDFLSTDDFADLATFTPAGGAARPPVPGIFDEPYFDRQLGEYTQGMGEPRFTCKASDVVGIRKHDECTIAGEPGVKYELVSDPDPDGTGMATVRLARVFD